MSRKILLGVTGSIAAYKSAELVRRLRERGCEVQVVMTGAATSFVTAMTFQALSGRSVRMSLLDEAHEAAMGHIELARWPDQVIVAPASADFIARLAAGMANDLLSGILLATDRPVAVAPAMNQQMWRSQATRDNVCLIRRRGLQILGPAEGEQACGETGEGRMLEPAQLADALCVPVSSFWSGKKVLLTAGPTREAIDPVRYISNRSSGKMGYAIAEVLERLGADVYLVSGPVALDSPAKVQRTLVESADDMHQAVMAQLVGVDVFIATAAVADYGLSDVAAHKIKKTAGTMLLTLEKNRDILADVAATSDVFTLGFAAETQNLEQHARQKLAAKKLDMVAANQVNIKGQGFDADNNSLLVVWNGGKRLFPLQNKSLLAQSLVGLLEEQINEKSKIKNN